MTDELKQILLELVDIAESNELTPNSQYLRMKEKIKNLKTYLILEKTE